MGQDVYCAICGALARHYDPAFYEGDGPYNTDLMSREDCEWLGNVRVLGYRPDLKSHERAFLTSRATGREYGLYVTTEDVTFPNGESTIETYNNQNGTVIAFPIHSACYKQLCIALAPAKVDLDVLYETFKSICNGEHASCLELDYGDAKDCMSYLWVTQQGTEDMVTSPSSDQALIEYYRSLTKEFPQNQEKGPLIDPQIGPGTDAGHDPFHQLSAELILQIMELLDTPSVRQWRASSRPVAQLTIGHGFWRSRICHSMPWVYDFPQDDDDMPRQVVDWLSVFKKLDAVSDRSNKIARQLEQIRREEAESNAPLGSGRQQQMNDKICMRDWSDMNLKLTNRRRIWSVIHQVLDLYSPRKATKDLAKQGQPPTLIDAELTEIPKLILPEPMDTSSRKVALLQDFGDLATATPTMIICWKEGGELADIQVQQPDSTKDSNTEEDFPQTEIQVQDKAKVPKEGWLIGFVIVSRRDERKTHKDTVYRRIVGLGCLFSNGMTKSFGQTDGDYRVMLVSPEHFAVGFSVTTSKDSVLTSLALLQQPMSKAPSCSNGRLFKQPDGYTSPNEPVQRLGNQFNGTFNRQAIPYLWKGEIPPAAFQLHKLVDAHLANEITDKNLSPMEALVFGYSDNELSEIVALSVDTLLRGFQLHYSTGKVRSIGPNCDAMVRLNIDGKGGERIVELYVSVNYVPTCMRFVTNRGRQLIIGQRKGDEIRFPPKAPGQNVKDGGEIDEVLQKKEEEATSSTTNDAASETDDLVLRGIFGSWFQPDSALPRVDFVGTFSSPRSATQERSTELPVKTDSNGFFWAPEPPPASMVENGPVYGEKDASDRFRNETYHIPGENSYVHWLDCTRRLESVTITMCHAMAPRYRPICGMAFKYAQGTEASVGPSCLCTAESSNWTKGRSWCWCHYVAKDEADLVSKPHYIQDTFHVEGAYLKGLRLWMDSDKTLTGIQFVTTKGVESQQWGQCMGTCSVEIEFSPGKEDGAVGIKIFLDNLQRQLSQDGIMVAAIQALAEEAAK
ncbi:hypothetical protein FZEAL_794 [Fusarium zealandicum]|uniref:F-box domain-containing protein n=1 Tax=Fusarium zealandicum TaxID=1053134 RepID=A0A8H4UUG8_9HYPO|nr:hypothetical protein FZEAL_794 [Fusarium zealandicum]